MEVSSIEIMSPATSTTANSAPDALGQDTFLQLLVTQLKYQDPLNPMDSAQSLLQTAQFTMVDKLNVIADAVTGQQQFGQLSAVGSIVGKEAVYVDALGNQMTGMISSAKITEGGALLVIDGAEVSIDRVVSYSGEKVATSKIPDIPADVASMSRSEMLTGTDPVYVPYDGPRDFTVRTVVSENGELVSDLPFRDLFVAAGNRWGVPPQILATWPKQNQGSPLMQSHQTTPKASCSSSQQQRTGWAWTHQTQHQRSMVPLATSEPNLKSSTTWRWQSPHTTQAQGRSPDMGEFRHMPKQRPM